MRIIFTLMMFCFLSVSSMVLAYEEIPGTGYGESLPPSVMVGKCAVNTVTYCAWKTNQKYTYYLNTDSCTWGPTPDYWGANVNSIALTGISIGGPYHIRLLTENENYYEGCTLDCDDPAVPNAIKKKNGCCTGPSECSVYQGLFSPASEGCTFKKQKSFDCYEAGGTTLLGTCYMVRDAAGREETFCSGSASGCPEPNISIGSTWEESTYSDEATCEWELPDGNGSGGGGGTGGGGTDGGGTGGGGTGGGGTGGGGTEGGGTEGGGTEGGGTEGGGTEGGGTEGGGSEGGGTEGGGGTGGDGGEDGDGDNLGSWSGDGGLSGIGGIEGMDKGKDDLKGMVDGLLDKIENNRTIQVIKGHKYISTSSATCETSFSVFGQTFYISFCEFESSIRTFGNLLFGLMTIMGFVYVLRSM